MPQTKGPLKTSLMWQTPKYSHEWTDVFQVVQTPSDCIMTEGRRVNIALRQDHNCVLLSIQHEFKLLLILLPD